MNKAVNMSDTKAIVVEEVFPHKPEVVWKTLTTSELIGRWLMVPTGFEPVKGKQFTFQTTRAGQWDGVIHLQVLEVIPNERLVYSWKGGHETNTEYGSLLDTLVEWTLAKVPEGTRLRLEHSGFRTPRNDSAFNKMSGGWSKVVQKIGAIAAEQNATEGK